MGWTTPWSLLLLLACAEQDEPLAARPGGVIVVSMDTVRWDHTSLGGYAHDTTPNLARLAAQPGAVTFQRAYTTATWSLPAYASLFTGQEVLSHGIGFTRDDLRPTDRTLAEVFQAYGYQTRAHCSGPHLNPKQGFDRGFDGFVGALDQQPLAAAVNGALRWLEGERDPERPFFLFVQGYDAHIPYTIPTVLTDLFDHPALPCERACGPNMAGGPWRCVPRHLLHGADGLSAEQLGHVVSHYDSAVYYADYQLGRLLRGLEALALLDAVTIVVLSDHGEGLGDDGHISHDKGCSEGLFHVPLVIRQPVDTPPTEEDAVVSLAGLAPTLLTLAGLTPPADADGARFDGLLSGSGAQPDGLARSASKTCYTVRDAAWRYAEPWEGHEWTPLPPWLHADGSTVDQKDAHPDVTRRLSAEIADWPRGMDFYEISHQRGRQDPALQRALQHGGYWSPEEKP